MDGGWGSSWDGNGRSKNYRRNEMEDGWGTWDGNNRSHKYGRPPHHPGSWHSTVPSWEKRFCTSVCFVPWGKICAAKTMMSAYKNVAEWDDSAGLEAFQNAKARYWASINGLPSDIPLPSPDIYIDKVDHQAVIDPELIADLEKPSYLPAGESGGVLIIDKAAPLTGWGDAGDSKPVPQTGWGDAETGWGDAWNNNTAEHRSPDWDVYIEKPIQPTGWGDAEDPAAASGDLCNAWKHDGWGDGIVEDGQWGGEATNGKDNSWGPHSDHWNNDVRTHGRKRNRGHYGSRFSKSRHQVNNYQANNSSWKDNERNAAGYANGRTVHEGQPAAVRQWKSMRSCGPMNYQRAAERGGSWHWEKSVI